MHVLHNKSDHGAQWTLSREARTLLDRGGGSTSTLICSSGTTLTKSPSGWEGRLLSLTSRLKG